ncbi:tRNA-queuosine alpha-mannosyltransferase domain-containing protein [Amphritea sp. HPY]|uniref:tRNA-queuosine alpha-mannosyltransferase domain-containing protein n=1 Tax=Amphritea sp. HPY TaxID=3421652 RepID=UPI003D7C368B
MKILLLSAYDAASHAYWRKGLVAHFPDHDWTVLTLPARYFSWRVRGNSLSWAFGEAETLQQDYDLVIATSMTDLSALRGFVPSLGQIPTLVYVHENQFAYPESGREYGSVEPKILNIYTALAADHLCFNTEYNRQSFLDGCRKLLKKLPDQVPPGLTASIADKSSVVPVPLPEHLFLSGELKAGPLQLVWNHRWEFDKGPELLLKATEQLITAGIDFKLHVVGQQFRQVPAAFAQLKTVLGDRAGSWGFMESVADYRRLLQQSDVVISTALHDFQGIAVLEGVAAGCIPVVPDRLAYTELFPADCRYRSGDGETESLVAMLTRLAQIKAAGSLPCAPSVKQLGWQSLGKDYAELIRRLTGQPAG